jgi:hypothetical protein
MSLGYIATKLDLSDFANQNIRFRFRIGTSGLYGADYFLGWLIDDFRIYTCATPYPATVSLAYPNGGETLYPGNWETITWQAPRNTAYVNLSYTLNNGVTWKTIVKNFSGNAFQWFVPYQTANKTKCRVKVTAYNSNGAKVGVDQSLPFRIEALSLISPNGTENWDMGTVHQIEWVTQGTKKLVDTVQLFYTIDGGVTWKKVPGSPLPDNPGTHDWTLPTVPADKPKCKVKVVLKDAGGKTLASDLSDGFFTINKP